VNYHLHKVDDRIDIRMGLGDIDALLAALPPRIPQTPLDKVTKKLLSARGQLESRLVGGTHRLTPGQNRSVALDGGSGR
jgi:hypothetical protein